MKDRKILTGWRSVLGRGLFASIYLASALTARNHILQAQASELERKVHSPETAKVEVVRQNQTQNQAKPQEKINYKTTDFSTDSDEVLLARMLFGEARNCSDEEMIDVAYTAVNRARDRKRWNGETLREAVLKPWQYSCFNDGDPNLPKLKDPQKYDAKSWERCLGISKNVLSGEYAGKNEGSTHYFAEGTRTPNWADSPQMTDISEPKEYKHDFFREK